MARLQSGVGLSFSLKTLNMYAPDTAWARVFALTFKTLNVYAPDSAWARVFPLTLATVPWSTGVLSRPRPGRPASRRTDSGFPSTRGGKFERFPSGLGETLTSTTSVDNPCSTYLGKNKVARFYIADSSCRLASQRTAFCCFGFPLSTDVFTRTASPSGAERV